MGKLTLNQPYWRNLNQFTQKEQDLAEPERLRNFRVQQITARGASEVEYLEQDYPLDPHCPDMPISLRAWQTPFREVRLQAAFLPCVYQALHKSLQEHQLCQLRPGRNFYHWQLSDNQTIFLQVFNASLLETPEILACYQERLEQSTSGRFVPLAWQNSSVIEKWQDKLNVSRVDFFAVKDWDTPTWVVMISLTLLGIALVGGLLYSFYRCCYRCCCRHQDDLESKDSPPPEAQRNWWHFLQWCFPWYPRRVQRQILHSSDGQLTYLESIVAKVVRIVSALIYSLTGYSAQQEIAELTKRAGALEQNMILMNTQLEEYKHKLQQQTSSIDQERLAVVLTKKELKSKQQECELAKETAEMQQRSIDVLTKQIEYLQGQVNFLQTSSFLKDLQTETDAETALIGLQQAKEVTEKALHKTQTELAVSQEHLRGLRQALKESLEKNRLYDESIGKLKMQLQQVEPPNRYSVNPQPLIKKSGAKASLKGKERAVDPETGLAIELHPVSKTRKTGVNPELPIPESSGAASVSSSSSRQQLSIPIPMPKKTRAISTSSATSSASSSSSLLI